MEIIYQFNNFLIKKYSNVHYDQVITGLTIHHLSYLKANLAQGKRCLVIFPYDIVENYTPNILASDSTLMNMFMLHLRNLTMDRTDNSIEKRRIDDKYKANVKLLNENFNYLKNKYLNILPSIELVTKLPTNGFILQNLITGLVLNHYLGKANCKENKLRLNFHFMHHRLNHIEPNQILMRELIDLYNRYKGRMRIQTYTEVECEMSKSLIMKDKINHNLEKIFYEEHVKLQIPFKTFKTHLNLTIDNELFYKGSVWVKLFSGDPKEIFIAKYLHHGNVIRETLMMKGEYDSPRMKEVNQAPSITNAQDSSFFSSLPQLTARLKYIKMKVNQIRNYLQEQYIIQSMKVKQKIELDLRIPDLEIFPIQDESPQVNYDDQKENVNFLTDKYISYYPSRDMLRYLLSIYGETGAREILFSQNNTDKDILIPQVEYEVKHRFLKNPLDFFLKRHDYSERLKLGGTGKYLQVLTLFAKEFDYDMFKYKKELFKYFIFIHLI